MFRTILVLTVLGFALPACISSELPPPPLPAALPPVTAKAPAPAPAAKPLRIPGALVEMKSDQVTSPALAGNLVGDPATCKLNVLLPPSYASSLESCHCLQRLAFSASVLPAAVSVSQGGIS